MRYVQEKHAVEERSSKLVAYIHTQRASVATRLVPAVSAAADILQPSNTQEESEGLAVARNRPEPPEREVLRLNRS